MDICIIGAGGHGRVVLDILRAANSHRVVGFIDANAELAGKRIDGVPVLGGPDRLAELQALGVAGVVVAIGQTGVRRAYAEEAVQHRLQLVNAVHPSAQIASTARLGNNVVVCAGAVICAHCQINDSAILNTACIIDHESVVGTAAHVCPGVRIAGHVVVDANVFVGIGATIIQNIRIGFDAIVGAGAVVIRDVAPMTTVVGVPARPIRIAPTAREFAALLSPRGTRRDGSSPPLGPRQPARRHARATRHSAERNKERNSSVAMLSLADATPAATRVSGK